MNYNRRLGAFRPSVRLGKHGAPMRDPAGHDIDITSDLTDGSDGALADVLPTGGQPDVSMQAPQGTVPKGSEPQPTREAAPKQTQQEASLRDQLSSAFKGPDDKPTDQQGAQSANQAPALTKDETGKYRNVDGTFASAEQVAAFEAAQNTQGQQAAATAATSPVTERMTATEAQQFQSLPAELQQYVARTMEDLNTRGTRYSEYDQIEQNILGPRREAFAAEGTNPVVALNQLFALSDFAGRDPANFVMWFAEQQRLDLDALLDARDAQHATVDPQVRQLQEQVQQLSGTVQSFQQQNTQSVQQQNYAAVEQFAVEKDATGAMLRPYLTDVMDGWTQQITSVRAANPNMAPGEILQKAYENACWADPTVRGKMQEASNARATEAARVQAAKAAGSSVSGAPAGKQTASASTGTNRTLREELQAQFAEQGA